MSDELESRLQALERPGNFDAPLTRSDFWLMAATALFLPIGLLLVGWGL